MIIAAQVVIVSVMVAKTVDVVNTIGFDTGDVVA